MGARVGKHARFIRNTDRAPGKSVQIRYFFAADNLYPFFCWRLRNRTPGPPAFSSMNLMRATSTAVWIFTVVPKIAFLKI